MKGMAGAQGVVLPATRRRWFQAGDAGAGSSWW